ncbi:MAG: aspartate dehydrogenase [Tissierellaceae bacterium]|nr:aspartate dehydrogenase [Tissierellaceae bacterium]
MKKYRISIIGSGSLGSIIGKNISKELYDDYEVVGILSGRIENALKLANQINCKAYNGLDEMLNDKPDYIIEAASPDVVKNNAVKILENGVNLIVLSVGALADEKFYKTLEQKAIEKNSRVHLASGAVGGFDVLNAAMLMEDATVTIITEKAPNSLNGAPFLDGRELSQDNIEDVFTGTAKEAIKAFPKNINVAVATALATTGVDNTNVVIRSIPGMKSNKHSIKLVGNTVKVNVEIESTPSIDNPKSSTLAAWSVISLLKRLVSPITF